MKTKIVLLFLFTAITSVLSNPIKLLRLYNNETGVCIDIISDAHEINMMSLLDEKKPQTSTLANSYATMLKDLHTMLNGDLKFICEGCTEATMSPDLNTFEDLNKTAIAKYKAIEAKYLYEYMQPIIARVSMYDENAGAKILNYTKRFTTDFTHKGMIAVETQKQLSEAIADDFNGIQVMKNNLFLLKLINEISQITPPKDVIYSDHARYGVLEEIGSCQLLDLVLINAPNLKLTPKQHYKMVNIALMHFLFNSILILKYGAAGIDSKIVNDKHGNIPIFIKQQWQINKDIRQKTIDAVIPILAALSMEYFIDPNDTSLLEDMIMNIYPTIQFLSLNLFNFEALVNIFSSNNKHFIVLTGDIHCLVLCDFFERLGFVNVAEIGTNCTSLISAARAAAQEKRVDRAFQCSREFVANTKQLDAETVKPLLFEDPQLTYQKYLSSK